MRKNNRKTDDRKMATNLDNLFETFFTIKTAEGRAPGTLKQYRENYQYFAVFLDKRGIPRNITDITRNTIRDYIRYMQTEVINTKATGSRRQHNKQQGFRLAR
ncbi:phage integrase SAM-like domain-containing protein [Heyndrickxia coagulans]|uniref:phage integrase SAM-like domain-containing protein n=1 Tax=Heyndrickxia coagulans TaxID=1398 RepID=UPI002E223845|nr:phage integrase SAM-like domain-containing protein [Heyndrickxia coagulans]